MAGKKERQRRLAREKYERQQARRVHHARRWRSGLIIALVCLTVVGTGAGAYFLLRGGSKPASAAAASPHPTASPSGAASAATAEPASHCTYQASPPAARTVGGPPATPDGTASYRATIVTNRGDVVIQLLNAKATCAVNSFVFLAAKKYFNNTRCHRLTTSGIYVLQCGDPTGTGSGGPGYKFADENLSGAKYTAGTVAMANAGPGTNGSQFFLVYRNSLSLHPNYTPFGTVVKGLRIIQNVAKAGTDNANGPGDGHPKEKVVIERVIIKKT
ncbi:MAG TPA: peptidylprolyl isomerase [Streptosporangiaceae bacterium]|nr:peptidylprolyl isomerase [Streptosporangiaceae bacterium]